MKGFPGFVSANFHFSPDKTRIINYAQWRGHEDLDAMKHNPDVERTIAQIHQIAESFKLAPFELRESVAA